MFEILLASCLVSDPTDCGSGKIPVTGTIEDCRATAREIVAQVPSNVRLQEYPCVEKGQFGGLTMSEVAPGLFVHHGHHGANPTQENGADLANLSFIVGDQAVAVIDSGTHPSIGDAMLRAVRAETDLPIKWVILTHMHPDHAMGTGSLTVDGAAVTAHHKMADALALRAGGYLQNLQRLGLTDLTEADVVLPTDLVAEPRKIDLGNRELTLTPHATAHTNNDLTIFDHNSSTLILGDLLFVDHTPAIDGSIVGWQRVLGDLIRMPAERAVPGHGPVSVRWPDGAYPLIRYLDTIATDARAAIADGTPMIDAIKTIGESERPNWLLFDDFNPRNASAAFQELEWE